MVADRQGADTGTGILSRLKADPLESSTGSSDDHDRNARTVDTEPAAAQGREAINIDPFRHRRERYPAGLAPRPHTAEVAADYGYPNAPGVGGYSDPRGITHSCAAPPASAIRSKSES